MEKVRLSKLMSEQGLCSRREADSYIEQGLVFVDGERISELGTKIYPTQKITLAKGAQVQQQARVTILLHKPMGYVSGQAEDGYQPAVTLVNAASRFAEDKASLRFTPSHLKGLAPAGRLDIDSTGLLVLTQDGRIAKLLIGDDSRIEKEYLVRVQGKLSDQGMKLLNHGLSLDGQALKPAKVSWQNEDQHRPGQAIRLAAGAVALSARKRTLLRVLHPAAFRAQNENPTTGEGAPCTSIKRPFTSSMKRSGTMPTRP